MFKYIFLCVAIILPFVAHVAPSDAVGNAHVVPGQYIVVLKDSVTDSSTVASEMGRTHGLSIAQEYSHALKGFSATIPAARLNAVKNDPRVAFVSEDRVVAANGKPSESAKGGTVTPPPPQVIPFGIQRIGATSGATGAGVGVAIIDTGINAAHPDLKGNVSSLGKTCVSRTRTPNDDNGHGTHVAGTVAALNNTLGVVGVAPSAKLFAVKVLDRSGNGTWSSVICGIDWVTANAATQGIKVANMSLSGTGVSDGTCENTTDALHKAICNSTATGVTYVVAAGNGDANGNPLDATSVVPAAYSDTVITVSALADSDGLPGGLAGSTDDIFASFSNYGEPVTIGAPGVNIYSTWLGSSYATLSGTSMATPHVAGAVARYKQTHPTAPLSEVRSALVTFGEALDAGHTDPSDLHSEPVLQVSGL
jgi:subtilisin